MWFAQSHTALAVLLGMAQAMPQPHHHAATSRASTTFDARTASLDDFASYALETAMGRIANSTGTCTTENVIVRKLFENLSGDERIAYTSALKCLMNLEAKTPSEIAAGAKTRYDDWIVTHINQTLSIHSTVCQTPSQLPSNENQATTDNVQSGKLPRMAPMVYLGNGVEPA